MDIVKKVLPNVNQNQGSFERQSVDDHNGAARIKPNDGSMEVAGGGAAAPARSPVLRRTLDLVVNCTCSVRRPARTKIVVIVRSVATTACMPSPKGEG